MSFTFRIECPRPTVDSLRTVMKRLQLSCIEELPLQDRGPLVTFIFTVTASPLERPRSNGMGEPFASECFTTPACPQDYHIAVELAAYTAGKFYGASRARGRR